MMTPEHQLIQIFGHLQDLQYSTLDLDEKIKKLSELHTELPVSDSQIDNQLPQNLSEIQTVLSSKMDHTEQMIQNMLHPDRIDQIVNFMKVMNDAMNDVNDINQKEVDDGPVV